MKIASLLLLLPLIGCVTATVNEPGVCDSLSLGTFPGSPVVIHNPPPESFSTQENFSDTLHKVSQVTDNYSVGVTQLSLTSDSDLSWVTGVQVYVGDTSGSVPNTLFASYNQTTSARQNSLDMQVQMDANTLTTYLKNPIELRFVVTGSQTPTTATQLGAAFCITATGSVSKSL